MGLFTHVPGNLYLIMEGVRRAKAAQLHGHSFIRTEVVDQSGRSLGETDIPLDSLRSPKRSIGRATPTEQARWQRADEGAKQAVLPFPKIVVQPTKQAGTALHDVDLGEIP